MKTFGLVGGVASGKSSVAQCFERLGAVRVDADRIGHDVLQSPEVRQELIDRWGSGILAADGGVDRRAVAKLVFGDDPFVAGNRRFLESVTHPRIREQLLDRIQRAAADGALAVALDIPLLLETNWREQCDAVLFVDAPLEVRQARAVARGWDAAELARREASQLAVAEKRAAADFVIDNGGSLEETAEQVAAFWGSQFGTNVPH